MDNHLVVLKLFIDGLGLEFNIESVNHRKALQKAVYLGQQKVDLGYKYSWYLRGPYSPALTQDYFELEAYDNIQDVTNGKSLRSDIVEKLGSLKVLFTTNKPSDMKSHDWLELLCSIHFLMTTSNKTKGDTKKTITEQKNHLIKNFDTAYSNLNNFLPLNR